MKNELSTAFSGDYHEIHTPMVTLNEYINKCRAKCYAANSIKQKIQAKIAMEITLMPMYLQPIAIVFIWFEPNLRRDLDNISFEKKFILDTMVKLRKIRNDSPKYVRAFVDKFQYSKGNPRKVVMHIKKLGNEFAMY